MSRVIVVGGGASGLVAAIQAARNNNQVTIIERNNTCGKKILITGNGKCNYWNEDQDINHYHSSNPDILSQIITVENQNLVLEFFHSIGIVPKINKGYYYPYPNIAASIQYALKKEVEVEGVTLIENVVVNSIEKEGNEFIINSDTEHITCDKLILATGSKACPKTGSDGIGYDLAKRFGHTIIPVLPALVQLKGEGNYFKLWNGIRTYATLTLYEDGKYCKEESGELQLTEYGISGICVFNISRFVSNGLHAHKKEAVMINFAPWFTGNVQAFIEWMGQRNQAMTNRKLYELLEGFLHYKLVDILLKISNIDKQKSWIQLTDNEKKILVELILAFPLEIIGTNSFDKAQVCSGGVSLEEINPITMESKKVKGLYIAGELLDVDGDCGGYNLGFAWISGMIAGRGVESD